MKKIRNSKKATAAVAAGAIVVVGAGAAYAAYASRATVTGRGTTGSYVAQWTGTPSTTNSTATIDTTAQINGTTGSMVWPVASYFPGDRVVVTAPVKVVGDRSGYVSGLTLGGLPAGYTAKITAGCGAVVTKGNTTGTSVTVEIALADTAAADGAAWTIAPGSGVEVTSGTAPGAVTCAPVVGA